MDGQAAATINLGLAYARVGRLRKAREQLDQGLRLAVDCRNRTWEANARSALGDLLLSIGLHEDAKTYFEGLLAVAREIGSERSESKALTGLGEVAAAEEDAAAARALLKAALTLGRKLGRGETVHRASVLLALLPGGDAAEALEAFDACRDQLGLGARKEAHHLLWRAMQDSAHLEEAKRLLDHLVEHAPEEYRESMLKNVRLNREIMEAWAEHGEKVVVEGGAD